MGDSGISSPPAAPSLSQAGSKLEHTVEVEEEIEEEEGDKKSGLEGGSTSSGPDQQQKIALPGMKKRDTMIRELKSKLKEKFHQVCSRRIYQGIP